MRCVRPRPEAAEAPVSRFALLLATFMTAGIVGPGSTVAQELAWTALPDMPIGKWEAATAVIDGKIYLFGGYIQNVRSSKRSDVFDPNDGSWT